jgi:hypothetical protein
MKQTSKHKRQTYSTTADQRAAPGKPAECGTSHDDTCARNQTSTLYHFVQFYGAQAALQRYLEHVAN